MIFIISITFVLSEQNTKLKSHKNVCKNKWVILKLCNEPQRATTNHSKPQQATTSHNEPQQATMSHSDPQQTTTTHNNP